MNCCPGLRRFLVAAAVFLAASALASAENWPQWRGPNNDGISTETGIPAEWDATKNILWKLPMPGMAGSTPCVWGDRIFLTSEDGGDIAVLCVGTDGKKLWEQKVGSGKRRFRGDEANQASASPSTDGKHVYSFFGTGDFVCHDFEGKQVWHFNAEERYGKFRMQWGTHTSPVLYGDRLYLALLHSGGHWVIALDRNTGNEVWKVERKTDGRAECEQNYASPTIWHKGNDAYLVVHGNDYATGHRLDDGKEIWRLGGLNPKDHYNPTLRFVASPVATPDLIVVPSAKNGPVVAVKPDATGAFAKGSAQEQWRMDRNTPDVPSPLVHTGLVYLCRENGVLLCLDAKTGKELYQQRLHSDRYRASPVYADGKIYCTARGGVVSVVKAGPTFELLSVNRLPDVFTASPVVSGGRIYLRGWENLYAVGGTRAGS